MLTVILAVGLDRSLLGARAQALKSVGYIVKSALSLKEVVDCFSAGDFDLVILCHSIPAKDRERLTCLLRASGSRIPIISVSGSGKPYECDAFANATLQDNPDTFLIGVRGVLLKAAKAPAAWNTPQDRHRIAAPEKKRPNSIGGQEQQPRTENNSVALAHAS